MTDVRGDKPSRSEVTIGSGANVRSAADRKAVLPAIRVGLDSRLFRSEQVVWHAGRGVEEAPVVVAVHEDWVILGRLLRRRHP